MTTLTTPQPTNLSAWRASAARLSGRISPATLALLGIMLLAAALNFANIDAIGDANGYYTAAVKAMLQSPSNFFFVAAEPGGSVTIDKPPLGLWLQAVSAMFLGVNGFAVVLPQILAGILSVPLLYHLVKRYFGTGAGLIAALVMAIMPVSVAVQRNNTMDATLIFTLLLAAWAFVRATDTGRLKWLLLGGVLVGLGFNIKMLQAFLPVPAFYALYILGANVGWRRKIGHLILTTVVLLAVSLSWVIAVDLTPANQRPYVGSSETNSALELALGYNGVQRLLGGLGGGRDDSAPAGSGAATAQFAPPAGFEPPAGITPPGAGGGLFSGEIGAASALRLFTQPLDNEIGWLLPFGLVSIGLLVVASRPRLPLTTAHKGAALWGGWLLTTVIFFSIASFFHAYYLAMLTPPLAALVGIGVMRLWNAEGRAQVWGQALLVALTAATLAYQASIAAGYSDALGWLVVPAAVLVAGAVILLITRFAPRYRLAGVGLACVVVALTLTPAVWAAMTSLENTNNFLPSAYGGDGMGMPLPGRADDGPAAMPEPMPGMILLGGGGGVDSTLLDFLQANTQGMRWMMAVNSSMQGSSYVIETGRGVLYMGGFSGLDPVLDAAGLQAYVDAGDLRYVLTQAGMGGPNVMGGPNGGGASSDINDWLEAACSPVTEITVSAGTLYDCAG